jgi:drug/metabolite transporter (DMT)-like permease
MESLPDEGSPVPRVHPLEIPFVWFGLQLVELGIVTVLFRLFLPRDWPWGLDWAIWLVLLIGLTIVNYRIRRLFIPR